MVTNELLIKKIKQQVNEAAQLTNDPILFKEALKRVELLCELVTEEVSEPKGTSKVTPELLEAANHNLQEQLIETSNKQTTSVLPNDSIFDF